MLMLVVCLALWDFSSCAVIRKILSSKWDNGIPEWQKDFTLPTTSPPLEWDTTVEHNGQDDEQPATSIDWNRFIMKTFDSDRSTVKPFDSDRFATKPLGRNRFKFIVENYWKRFTNYPNDYKYMQHAKSIDWNRLTMKPFDSDRATVKPFDSDRFTAKRLEGNGFIFTPIPWERFTYSPDDFKSTPTDITPIMLMVFLPTLVVLVIVLLCKLFVCEGDDCYLGTSTITQRPRRDTPPPTGNVFFPPENGTRTTESARHITDAPNRGNATDRPPGYSDVVLADLSGGKVNFPEVKPTILETPPPIYDVKNMKY